MQFHGFVHFSALNIANEVIVGGGLGRGAQFLQFGRVEVVRIDCDNFAEAVVFDHLGHHHCGLALEAADLNDGARGRRAGCDHSKKAGLFFYQKTWNFLRGFPRSIENAVKVLRNFNGGHEFLPDPSHRRSTSWRD